jgi:hypothetical protein
VSLHLHVELEPWAALHPGLRGGLLRDIAAMTGVRQINDLEVLSLETIKEWCLPAEESLVKPRTHRKRKVE